MSTVLILSSYVAASRVGGGAQALAFARLGIEPILVPTVTFGRHPGWGPPGGGPVTAETMQAITSNKTLGDGQPLAATTSAPSANGSAKTV